MMASNFRSGRRVRGTRRYDRARIILSMSMCVYAVSIGKQVKDLREGEGIWTVVESHDSYPLPYARIIYPDTLHT